MRPTPCVRSEVDELRDLRVSEAQGPSWATESEFSSTAMHCCMLRHVLLRRSVEMEHKDLQGLKR